ncbi:transposase, IS21 family protein [Pandoraea sp. SD6-2]|nr:transposase, IS21 family protein [Pandoraea sp. SD6-2]
MIAAEGCADFEEEIFLVTVSVGAAFDDFDGVVDALNNDAGVQKVSAAG